MPLESDFTSRAAATAKQKSLRLIGAAQDRSRQFVNSAHHYIEENPVRAVSYSSAAVLGLGILIGRLLAPQRPDVSSMAAEAGSRLQDLPDALRGASQELLAAAKQKSHDLIDTAQERSREILEYTRDYAQENPWRTASYAVVAIAGLALIAGLIATAKPRYDSHW